MKCSVRLCQAQGWLMLCVMVRMWGCTRVLFNLHYFLCDCDGCCLWRGHGETAILHADDMILMADGMEELQMKFGKTQLRGRE